MAPGKKIPKLEFKSADGAWYDVAIELTGPHLKVHYEEFDEDDDENLRWEKEFKTVDDVRSRLRFSSKQLQDQHCERLKEGMNICASFSTDGEDNKFFDAVVEQVHRSEHPLVDGERQCACVFKVLWQAGPAANQTTSVSCENICLLTAGSIETHPVINDLLRLVEEKLASRTRSVGRNPLGSKRKNTKGKQTKNFKGRQAQQGKRADDKHMDCETPTRRDDVSFSNGREVSENPGSMSSQSKEKEKQCEEVNATENILTSHEVLLQERAASDNELKSSVESECDVGSETNISRYSHGGTMLKEDVVLSKATIFEGENDICKKDSLPPDAASLASQNKNIQHEIVPKNRETIDAEILNESNKTNLNVGRKEEKPNLPDLNLLPVELETVDPCTDSLSSAMSYTNTVGNNVSTTNKKFWELDNSAVIIENSKTCHSGWSEAENVRPCHSGWLEAEDCDNLIEECTDYNVVRNIIDNSGRKNNQLAIREDQKGQEITEDKSVKDNLLCVWGRGKRHKFGNEMLLSERPVQHESQESEGTKTLKNFFQLTNGSDGVDPLRSSLTNLPSKPHNTKESLDCYGDKCGIQGQPLQSVEQIGNGVYEGELSIKHLRSNKVQTHKVSLGGVDNKNVEFINDSIDTLKSSCLTDSSVKPIKGKDMFDGFKDSSGLLEETIKDPLDCSRDEYGIQDQMLQNVEEIGKDVYGDELPVKHLGSSGLQTPRVSLGAVNSKIGEFKSVDIDALKANCLTTLSMKPIKRREPFDSFKNLNGPPEQLKKKAHIDVCASRHEQFDCDVGPLEVLPETVVISSDDESDLAFVRKEHDHTSRDFMRQHSDHVYLQKGVHTTVDPVCKSGFVREGSCKRRTEDEMYHTSMCKDNINEPAAKEDGYYCTCRSNYPKNISAMQDQCNGHSLSEKYTRFSVGSDFAHTPSHWKVDPQRYCSHSSSKYYEQSRDGHMNEPGLMEDKSYCTCSFKSQKNVFVTQHQHNGHSLSEKQNYCSSGGPSHGKGLGL